MATVFASVELIPSEEVDQLPRGTALHVARSPFPKEKNVRVTLLSKQHSNSSHNGSNNLLRNPELIESDKTAITASRKVLSGADHARRAACRVNVWKKTEQDRRKEEERARQVKLEQEKHQQSQTMLLKQRRRAEIYALNAVLRQLQQEKLAQYIASQHAQQEEGFTTSVKSIGV